jgi:hypothetical protein
MMTIPGLDLFGQRIPDVVADVQWYTLVVHWLKQFFV